MSTSQAPIWELPDEERPIDGLDRHGVPDPAYAAALGLVSAPLGRRAGAAAIDIGCFCLLQLPLVLLAVPLFFRLATGRVTWYGFLNHPDYLVSVVVAAVTFLLTILLLVAQLMMQGRWGFTLGKLATGLRAVNVSTLAKPGFWRVTGRAMVVWLPALTVVGTVLFLASPLGAGHDRRRGWHDRVGRVWLVDVRQGLNPFDEKRMRLARKTVTSTPAFHVKSLPSLASSTGSYASNVYRPGARTSAGVLGAARPHTPEGRVVVGLTGLVPGEPAPSPAETPGPRLGAYLAGASEPGPADVAVQGAGAGHGGPAEMVTAVPGPVTPAPPTPSVPQEAGFMLLFDSGQVIQISGAVVLGRSPEAIGGALPLTIVDPDFSISKTHVVLRPLPTGLEVIDQGSTNGTALVHRGREQPLTAGEAGFAALGDTIRIGDRTARLQAS